MAPRVPDWANPGTVRSALDRYVRSIESGRLSLGIHNRMLEVQRWTVVICSTQSDYLLTKIQQRSGRILVELSDRDLALHMIPRTQVYDCLEIFICIMMAAEDLLYRCDGKDWKLAALDVFLPASNAPCHSRFALLARDLDCTYYILLSLLEANATERSHTSIGEALFEASNEDLSIALRKPEGGSSRKSGHQESYGSLLRRRSHGHASPSAPDSVPDWCWIPGELEYSYLQTIASANFKSVLKCQWLGMEVAVAIFTGEGAKKFLKAEASIVASVQHPNVVNLFGCAYDDEKQQGYLVTELMEQDLHQLIRKRVEPFLELVARDIILQIVEAMIHVHNCRVLHRDLKPANCLVSAKKRIRGEEGEETYYVVKLTDFGASTVRGADASTCHTRKQGTTAYMAPELHAKREECTYKWPADVYSFGMTMYEIFTGKFPFEGVYNGTELERRVCARERPYFTSNRRGRSIPDEWKNLIETCWHHDPERRPSFAWIRLEILRGLPHFHPDRYHHPVSLRYYLVPPSFWLRNVKMPSEITEELLQKLDESPLNTDDPGVLASIGLGLWNRVNRVFS